MTSVWIEKRKTRSGALRYRVIYQLGGRGQARRYAGSFRSQAEARRRKTYVALELASGRIPEPRPAAPPAPLTVADVLEAWRTSRLDVAPATATSYRVSIARISSTITGMAVDALTPAAIASWVAELAAAGSSRSSIAKSLTALRLALDHHGVAENVARDRRIRLPREVRREVDPPSAATVEDALRYVAPRYRLPLLLLEATGLRVGELEALTWGDLDERSSRVRVRAGKTGRPRWAPLPADLLRYAVELVPREDRDPDGVLFPGATQARMRTDLGRACRAAGVPRFGLHDLRHRWISRRLHEGLPAHEVARAAGHSNAVITLSVYAHVLVDDRAVDRAAIL